MASKPKTIILWTHPRSTSTMFECALLTRNDIRVLHEPMGDAYYFGPERVAPRYSAEVCEKDYPQYKDSTYKKTWENIVHPGDHEGFERTFSKDMAQYIFAPASSSVTDVASFPKSSPADDGNPTLIPTSILLDPSVHHTFLIRTPKKAVPSYHRLCYPGAETGFDYFDPEEAGYSELRRLFDFVRSKGERQPMVVESEQLLAAPEKVLSKWCEEVQVPFDVSMLEWSEGTREHFAKWPGWHSTAENSKGIGKGVKDELRTPCNYSSPSKQSTSEAMPEEVQKCIEDNEEDFQHLMGFVVQL